MWKLLLGSKPLGILVGTLVAAVLALATALVITYLSMSLQISEGELKLATAKHANADWSRTTQDLSEKLQACVGERQAIEDAAAQAVTDAQASRRALAAERAQRKTEREKLYADDAQCAAWAAAAVCGGIDQRLPR